MTFVKLVEGLADETREAVKGFKMKSELEPDKKVSVYEQEIPEEEFDSDSYYPLVIVALQSIDDDLETSQVAPSIATVGLTVGVYGEDKETWKDLLNLSYAIRSWLMTRPIIAKSFRLVSSVDVDYIERQPLPFHFCYVTVKYTVLQIEAPRIEWR